MPIKSKRIRIFPNQNQKNILKEWFGISRWFYNRSIDYISGCKKVPSKFDLRNSLKNQETRSFDIPDWCTVDVPERIITGSVMDCHKTFVSNFAKIRRKQITHFKAHYRTKKQGDQSLYFPKECFGKNNNESMFKTFLKEPIKGIYRSGRHFTRLKNMENINGETGKDCRLVSEEFGKRYYLFIPVLVDVINDEKKVNIVSIDSGIRTFQTCYSPAYHVLEIGVNTGAILIKFLSIQDKLRSLIMTTKNKRMKLKYRRKYTRIATRIKNMVNELHWKTINMLTKKYGVIILSDFRVSDLLKSVKLYKESKRILTLQRHYQFKQRLVSKCKERKIFLQVIDESYTSKTCCNCGSLHNNLGKSKVFKCPRCEIIIDRDMNGAVNMFIKSMSKSKTSIGGCALSHPKRRM